MKVCIYTRVSTEEQTTDNQTPVLTAWAQHRGWGVVKIYEEEGSAWRAGHQKQLAQLMKDARLGMFEVVLVWALDRLTREGAAAILNLVNKLGGYGVKVYSHEESWTEAPGPVAELLYALTGWVAKMESQRRSERTKAGMDRARAEGKHVGRPKGRKDTVRRKRGGYYNRWEGR